MNSLLKLNVNNASTFLMPDGLLASAKCALVGEQPGYQDVKMGKPFSGPSGRVLSDCLAAAGLVRGECYVTNVIKDLDHPLPFYAIQDKHGTQFTMAGQRAVSVLKEELTQLDSEYIIAIGNVALKALTGREGITKWRGSVIPCTLVKGKWVIPIIHPATILPPKCQYLNKNLIIFDLKRAADHIANGPYFPYEYSIKMRPSFVESIEFLDNLMAKVPMAAVDIEISNEEVSCISFCHHDKWAISIAFIDDQGDIFNPEQELKIWQLIARFMEDPIKIKIGQNLTFDASFLLRRYGIKTRNIQDTMVAQQIMATDYNKGLDFITVMHTPLPYYKDEGKRWFKVGGSWQQLWHYNGLDSLSCWLAFPHQMKELERQGNIETYNRQRLIIEPLTYLSEHGIKVDTEGMVLEHERMMNENIKLQHELNGLAGGELNANSPLQLKQYFYVRKKLAPYKKRGSGAISVDNDALKRLARKGVREAKLIQQIRKNVKIANTYLNIEKIDPDGRIRCSYNPVGTRYSRISSSSNIFGTGMNMQNWPHSVLRYLMADEGYVGYAFDLSQAENRIVAYEGNITSMIEAFENGIDVHSLTAALIFKKNIEDISDEDGSTKLGDGTHSERFWGKKANHGLNYDLGYKTFAFYYEIPEVDAKFIIERYHLAYPGVRQVFHKRVRDELYSSRTVTNLLGRKTLFFDELNDQTFKEAYACIPQGTVGDVINERGFNFVYYNEQQFAPVELLSQVHDEIVFQIPLSIPWHEHARIITDIRNSLEIPLTTHGREFVIPADLTIFRRFKQGKELKGKKFEREPLALADQLAATFSLVTI